MSLPFNRERLRETFSLSPREVMKRMMISFAISEGLWPGCKRGTQEWTFPGEGAEHKGGGKKWP